MLHYKKIREKAGLSRQEMANFLGISKATGLARIAAFECGSRDPSDPIKRLYYLIDTLAEEDKELLVYLLKSIDRLSETA